MAASNILPKCKVLIYLICLRGINQIFELQGVVRNFSWKLLKSLRPPWQILNDRSLIACCFFQLIHLNVTRPPALDRPCRRVLLCFLEEAVVFCKSFRLYKIYLTYDVLDIFHDFHVWSLVCGCVWSASGNDTQGWLRKKIEPEGR